jgi:hypothetical protein
LPTRRIPKKVAATPQRASTTRQSALSRSTFVPDKALTRLPFSFVARMLESLRASETLAGDSDEEAFCGRLELARS